MPTIRRFDKVRAIPDGATVGTGCSVTNIKTLAWWGKLIVLCVLFC